MYILQLIYVLKLCHVPCSMSHVDSFLYLISGGGGKGIENGPLDSGHSMLNYLEKMKISANWIKGWGTHTNLYLITNCMSV